MSTSTSTLLLLSLVLHTSLLLLLFTAIEAYLPPQDELSTLCNHDYYTSRAIPPLTTAQRARVQSLQQVQVIIRHGARTPWIPYPCWKDYDIIWNDCNVTELMVESPSLYDPNRPSPALFRKIYDASPTYLKGNCFTGQLLPEGYQQQQANGRTLQSAYLEGDLPLFPTKHWHAIDHEELVYLRSDDEQRTLMSGQILVQHLFNVSPCHLLHIFSSICLMYCFRSFP